MILTRKRSGLKGELRENIKFKSCRVSVTESNGLAPKSLRESVLEIFQFHPRPYTNVCLFVCLFVCFLLFQFVASTVQSTNIKRDERKEKIKQSREEDATERKGKLRETEKECGLGGFMNHY